MLADPICSASRPRSMPRRTMQCRIALLERRCLHIPRPLRQEDSDDDVFDGPAAGGAGRPAFRVTSFETAYNVIFYSPIMIENRPES